GRAIQEILLTHGHPDHMGGVASILDSYGTLRVSKFPMESIDEPGPDGLEQAESADARSRNARH
ncbi:MAG: MBL fold metallo-hydrolase, partial [Planctomycetes bacterium]|nr:MBL fold metallo-hydrolase [Planctomycetota bacterium]